MCSLLGCRYRTECESDENVEMNDWEIELTVINLKDGGAVNAKSR